MTRNEEEILIAELATKILMKMIEKMDVSREESLKSYTLQAVESAQTIVKVATTKERVNV